jgi:hypothetical protein
LQVFPKRADLPQPSYSAECFLDARQRFISRLWDIHRVLTDKNGEKCSPFHVRVSESIQASHRIPNARKWQAALKTLVAVDFGPPASDFTTFDLSGAPVEEF